MKRKKRDWNKNDGAPIGHAREAAQVGATAGALDVGAAALKTRGRHAQLQGRRHRLHLLANRQKSVARSRHVWSIFVSEFH